MKANRVVITGLGCISPVGNTLEQFMDAVAEGESALKKTSKYMDTAFSSSIVGNVKNFNVKDYLQNRKILKKLNEGEKFAIAAAQLAIEDSKIFHNKDWNESDAGIFLGTTKEFCSFDYVEDALRQSLDKHNELSSNFFGKTAANSIPPLIILEAIPNACLEYLSEIYQFKGANAQFMTTGVASTQAIGDAYKAIKRGEIIFALAGGGDSLMEKKNFADFDSIGLLSSSPKEFRGPFDSHRSGFALGEGSGMLILEDYEHAKKRNANIYCEMIGYETNMEARGLVSVDEEGSSVKDCIRQILSKNNIKNSDIDYVNAYASGTKSGDLSEMRAISEVFHNCDVDVSSIKGTIGHLIAASGSVECIATILAMNINIVPPSTSIETLDPACNFNLVTEKKKRKKMDISLKISRGMGGQNAMILFKKGR